MEMQKPPDSARDGEQARITMIATHMLKRAIERQRFFAEPLPEMDEVGEAIRLKRRQKGERESSALPAITANSAAARIPVDYLVVNYFENLTALARLSYRLQHAPTDSEHSGNVPRSVG